MLPLMCEDIDFNINTSGIGHVRSCRAGTDRQEEVHNHFAKWLNYGCIFFQIQTQRDEEVQSGSTAKMCT